MQKNSTCLSNIGIIKLDKKIEEEAIRKANEAVFMVTEESEKEKAVKQKENEIDKIIDDMAKIIIEENKSIVGEEIAEKAKEKIDKKTLKEGGNIDGKKEKTKGRTKKSI